MSTQQLATPPPRRRLLYGLRPVALVLAPFTLFWGAAVGGMIYGTVVTRTLQLGVIPEGFVFSLLAAIMVHAWFKPFDTPAPIGVPGTIIRYIIKAVLGMAVITGVAVVALSMVTP